ncbi:MAG TPA: helix-turn-helix domain-containing protein [Solirubrobacteraceae bacterium]|jgi:cytoskeletal protein RodZ|nr:helix-turn-helix domain-containing protein [Solirubrobacteraceae bacterium]
MPEIGETLRDARMRARIDVSEIEAKTKIRAKYLRALENEEWGLLPGPTFVKSFLRTYAEALDLDGKALVEEYRLNNENPSDALLEPIVSRPDRGGRSRSGGSGRQGGGGPSRGYLAIVGVIVVLIVLLVVGLVSKGGGSGSDSSTSTGSKSINSSNKNSKAKAGKHAKAASKSRSSGSIVALSLRPSAPVYVCLIGDNGRKAIPGEELQPGTSTSTYHAHRFLLTLGNSSVKLYIDGKARTVPASSQAIGYSITKSGGRKRLTLGNLPTCK